MWRASTVFKRSTNILLSAVLVSAQLVPLFIFTGKAYAAGQITFGAQFENQTFPDDPNIWTNGNLDNYSEGDYVNFRFQLTASDSTSAGKMLIEFDKGTCDFFTDYFNVASVTPTIATVTETTQTSSTQYFTQNLDVAFNTAGTTTVIFTLQLSNTAGECNGSNTAVRLGVPDDKNGTPVDENGDFTNVGAKSLPMAANQVLENPSLTITKTVQGGSADADDFSFSISPAITGVIDGVPGTWNSVNLTNGTVTIDEVNPDGQFVITEIGPEGYVFSSGTGSNCTVTSSGVMTASVTADADDPIDATCNFSNQFQTGNIIIEKQTDPDGEPTSFAFTTDYNAGFSLTDGQQNDSGSLAPGTYSVAETVPSGWDLSGVVCSDQSDPSAISLQANETVTCVFTNTKKGSITVQKTTLPAGDATEFPIQIEGSGTITGDTSGNVTDETDKTYTVTPGTYTVTETVPSGWDLTGTTCVDVVVAAGADVTCLLTNTKRASLTIVKDALPADDGTLFPFVLSTTPTTNFALDDDSTTETLDTETFSLEPGEYTVTEDLANLPSWVITDLDCGEFDFTAVQNGLTLTLDAGDNVTCTFTNTKFGSISGTKYEVNADGSLVDPTTGLAGWTIELYKDAVKIEQVDTDSNGDYFFDMLLPGNYEVMELLKDGWTQITPDGDGDHDITLTAGENSVDNDFGNFENGSISGYKWNDVDGDGNVDSEPKLAGWTIFIDENDNESLDGDEASTVTDANGNYTFGNLEPGTYVICEVIQTGWVQTYPGDENDPDCQQAVIDESGEALTAVKTRSFGNQGRGSITVIKDVVNDNGGTKTFADFSFDLDADAEISPDVTGNYDFEVTTSPDGSMTITGVPVGNYTVTEPEANTMGYTTSYGANCAELTVMVNETTTCTITNNDDAPSLTVVKEVVNDNGGDADISEFDIRINNRELTGNFDAGVVNDKTTTYTANPVIVSNRDYTLSEIDLAGYDEGTWDCGEGEGLSTTVNLSEGEDITCTITNNDIAPTLTVVKEVVNDNGGEATIADFDIRINGRELLTNFDGGVTDDDTTTYTAGPTVVSNKDYTLSELDLDGYEEGVWNCTNQTEGDELEITLRLDEGENVTCTITNDDISPTVIVTKYVESVNEVDETFNFELTNEGDVIEFDINVSTPDYENSVTLDDLKAGDMQLMELEKDGWVKDYLYCISEEQEYYGVSTFTAENGMTYYCYVRNSELATVVVTKINDTNMNGEWDEGETTLSDWEMNLSRENCDFSVALVSISEVNVCDLSEGSSWEQYTDEHGEAIFEDMEPGEYDLSETLQDGWVQTGIYCDERERQEYLLFNQELEEEVVNSESFYLPAGDTMNCYALNTRIEVDLEVDKDDDGVSTQPGGQFEYTIDVWNNAEIFSASEVTVTDVLDADLKFVSYEGTDWVCVLTGEDANGFGGTITCEYQQVLAAGDSAPTITFTVELSSDTTRTSIDNMVEVTSKELDIDLTNNEDTENTPVTRPAVLGEQTTRELPKTGESALLSVYIGLFIALTALVLTRKTAIAQKPEQV